MNMTETNIFLTESVNIAQKGQRLDKFLSQSFVDISRSQIQRLIEQGYVTCDDDTLVDNAFKVKLGDIYQLVIPEPREADPEPENIPLDIVFEDDDIVVVNKPAGMTVHPAPGSWNGTLVNALLYHCRDNLSGIGGVKRPGIVHRIDKDTSGLLVVAKNDFSHHHLCAQFFDHSIERTYFAVVHGMPNPVQGRIEANIGRSKFDRKKMAILKDGGKVAVTNYKLIQNFHNIASLVQCNLETGRTHQIRVHMASLGCNLVGDQLYSKSVKTNIKGVESSMLKYINNFSRQALHATTLGFIHPKSGAFVSFSSEFPNDFNELLKNLT